MRRELTETQQAVLAFLEKRQGQGELPPTVREICDHFGYRSTRSAADHLRALEKKGFLTRGQKSARGLRLTQPTGIPLLGRIAAGHARTAEEGIERRLPVSSDAYGIRDRPRAFALRVTGDSMIGRRLFDGDVVILEKGAEPRNGDVVAALIDNQMPKAVSAKSAAALSVCEALHASKHQRGFPWPYGKGAATDIVVYHSWHRCESRNDH
jgi:repressor LexA